MKRITFLLLFLFFLTGSPVQAVYSPSQVPNNKFGIHIIDENDLYSAAALVNSSGGDWGYVTMVITEDNRKLYKWQAVFSTLEKVHLIPILRLATRLNNDTWQVPKISQAKLWADFLDQLPWFTKNRYIVLFNEPNHAKEWGGQIDPKGYGQIVETFAKELKKKSADFFILPAGLDASANNSSETMDEAIFIKQTESFVPEVFDNINGWTSHSYPNPNFKGWVTDKGRGSLTTYAWELEILKNLGVEKDLPVFITETGWPHNPDNETYNGYYSPDTVADLIYQAAATVWNDSRIVAVTPFLLNYQAAPFVQFSWQKPASTDFYPQYDTYRSFAKVKGSPLLISKTINKTPSPTVTNLNKSQLVKSNTKSKSLTFLWQLILSKSKSAFVLVKKIFS